MESLNAKPSPGERDKVQEWRERFLCGHQVVQEDGVTYKARSWHAYDLGILGKQFRGFYIIGHCAMLVCRSNLVLNVQAVETCTTPPFSELSTDDLSRY